MRNWLPVGLVAFVIGCGGSTTGGPSGADGGGAGGFLGQNAVIGSACPKTLGPASPAHAYIPVVDAVARQLVGRLVQ